MQSNFAPSETPTTSRKSVGDLIRAGQVAVLAQTSRLTAIKQTLTKTGALLAAASMLAFANPANAGGFTLDRIAKDALGTAGGAALFGQFGRGKGKDALRVVGGLAGLATAEAMQQPKMQQPPPMYPPPQAGMQRAPQASLPAALVGGTEMLAPEKRERLAIQERDVMTARDAYARSLYQLKQAEENKMLNPQSSFANRELASANSAAQSSLQKYAQSRADFMNACDFMGKRGYDVHDFAYSYSLLQRPVTEKDMSPREMATVEVQPQMTYRQDF